MTSTEFRFLLDPFIMQPRQGLPLSRVDKNVFLETTDEEVINLFPFVVRSVSYRRGFKGCGGEER